MILLDFLFFFAVLQTLLVSISGSEICRQAGICLLENLAKYREFKAGKSAVYRESESQEEEQKNNRKRKRSNNESFFVTLPDILNIEIASYLEPSEVLAFENSSCHFYHIEKEHIRKQISLFSPFFVFKEQRMNRVMFSFLNATFLCIKDIKTISDPLIHDALSLINYHHIEKIQITNLFLSFDMIYLLLSFMFEIVYGPNELVPISMNQWKVLFIQRNIKFEMPHTMELYFEEFLEYIYNKADEEITLVAISNVKEFLRLIENKSVKKSTILEFYLKHFETNEDEESDDETMEPFYFAPEIKFALLREVHDEINSINIVQVFENLASNFSFSQEVLDRIPNNSIVLRDMIAITNMPDDWRILEALYKMEKVTVDANDARKYLWTRDQISNPFILEHFLSLEGNKDLIMLEMITFSSLKIYHIEILRQLVRSGIHNFQEIKSSSEIICKIYSSYYFNIILNEAPSPVNMFVLLNNNKYIHVFNGMIPDIEINFIFYIKSLKTDDPLPLIFMDSDILFYSKYLITDKFNLKKRYAFPQEPLNVKIRNVADDKWTQLQGKILGFKDVVDILFSHIEVYKEIFSSDSENMEIYEHDGSAPISVYDFLHYAVLIPLSKNFIN